MSGDVGAALVGFVLALLIFGGGPMVYRAWRERRHNALAYQRAWHWLAARTGLTFEPGQSASPRLVGVYRGRALTLTLHRDDGRPSRTFTRLHLGLRHAVPGRLTLARRGGLLAALWPRAAGDFLGRYQVTAEPPALARPVLTSASLKRKLLQAQVQIELDPDGLCLFAPGIVEDPEYLAFLFDLLSEAARLLEGAQLHAGPGDSAAPARSLVEA